MNLNIVFQSGVGNQVIFLESLIRHEFVKDKTKIIKYFFKNKIQIFSTYILHIIHS